jgi:hypothetical protein
VILYSIIAGQEHNQISWTHMISLQHTPNGYNAPKKPLLLLAYFLGDEAFPLMFWATWWFSFVPTKQKQKKKKQQRWCDWTSVNDLFTLILASGALLFSPLLPLFTWGPSKIALPRMVPPELLHTIDDAVDLRSFERTIHVPLHSFTVEISGRVLRALGDYVELQCIQRDDRDTIVIRHCNMGQRSAPGSQAALLNLVSDMIYSHCGAGPFPVLLGCSTPLQRRTLFPEATRTISAPALQQILHRICCDELRRTEEVELISVVGSLSAGDVNVTVAFRGLKGRDLLSRAHTLTSLVCERWRDIHSDDAATAEEEEMTEEVKTSSVSTAAAHPICRIIATATTHITLDAPCHKSARRVAIAQLIGLGVIACGIANCVTWHSAFSGSSSFAALMRWCGRLGHCQHDTPEHLKGPRELPSNLDAWYLFCLLLISAFYDMTPFFALCDTFYHTRSFDDFWSHCRKCCSKKIKKVKHSTT